MRMAGYGLSRSSARRSGTSAIPSKARTSCTLRFFLGEALDVLLDRLEDWLGEGEGDRGSVLSPSSVSNLIRLWEALPSFKLRLLERVTREVVARDARAGVALNCSNRLPNDGGSFSANCSSSLLNPILRHCLSLSIAWEERLQHIYG